MTWNGQSPVFECFGMGLVCACCALQSTTSVTALNWVILFDRFSSAPWPLTLQLDQQYLLRGPLSRTVPIEMTWTSALQHMPSLHGCLVDGQSGLFLLKE